MTWDSRGFNTYTVASKRKRSCTTSWFQCYGRSRLMKGMLALTLTAMLCITACTKVSADVDPRAIEQKYGLTGGSVELIDTENGKVQATVIPTTMDGRQVQLIIPHQPIGDHQVYMRDGIAITPMEL